MALTPRERAVALVAGGVCAWAAARAAGEVPPGASVVEFVMRGVPEPDRPLVDAALIDDVVALGAAHGS